MNLAAAAYDLARPVAGLCRTSVCHVYATVGVSSVLAFIKVQCVFLSEVIECFKVARPPCM